MKRLKDWNPTFWQAHIIALRMGVSSFVLLLPDALRWEGMIWSVLSSIGLIGVIIALVIEYRFWRCPYCGKQLPMRGGGLDFCSVCGAKLEKE